jgi:hypothetical protein
MSGIGDATCNAGLQLVGGPAGLSGGATAVDLSRRC